MKRFPLFTAALLALLSATAVAEEDPPIEKQKGESRNTCLIRALEAVDDKDMPISMLMEWCGWEADTTKQESVNALRTRLHLEENSHFNPFVVTPHNRNYLMPASYMTKKRWHDDSRESQNMDSVEAKFQISLKVPIKTKVFDHYDIYFAYTQTNFFQVYNESESRPFRETNYMPELYATRKLDKNMGPITNEMVGFGYVHQSNGRNIPKSRGWDRLFVQHVASVDSWYLNTRVWWRIPESTKERSNPRRDDNPDIEKYLGNFETTLTRPFGNHVAEFTFRNNLRSNNKGSIQMDYTFPLTGRFKGIFQAFTGYGDSLINYNDYQNRVSLGILLTDTL